MTVAICNKCGREFEVDKEEIEFNEDGFGFVYCPFCENDCVEFMDKKECKENYIKNLKDQIEELEYRLFELKEELREKEGYQTLEDNDN